MFFAGLDLFVSNLPDEDVHKIVICPLLAEKDLYNTIKSSNFLYYLASTIRYMYKVKFSQCSFEFVPTPLKFDPCIYSDHVLCLIDDFIGSGDTALSAYEYIKRKGVDKENVVIISLVAMKEGFDRLQKAGYKVYATMIEEKGIEGTIDCDNKYSIMQTIEDRIHIKKDYRFGYNHSEALVKMARIPNNTFPVYWMRGEDNPHAPFPRY